MLYRIMFQIFFSLTKKASMKPSIISRSGRLPTSGLMVLMCLLLTGMPGVAGAADDYENLILGVNDQLTLDELAAEARRNHPEFGLVAAHDERARAEQAYADHWFPERTQLGGFHMTDQPLDDTGFFEDEVSLNVPLWLPGEKRTQNLLAAATLDTSESAANAFAWRVSGEVRRALWDVLLTQRDLELAVEQETQLEQVLEQAVIFEEAGDIALGDRLAVNQELATWRGEMLNLEADYQDALRSYVALTSIKALPRDAREVLSSITEVSDAHPALRFAQDRYAQASADLATSEESNAFRPAVQFYWRGTRPDQPSPRIDALGVGLALPLGKSPSRGPELAAMNEAMAQAQANYLSLRRELELGLHEAEHTLHTIERQLENSRILMEATSKRQELDLLSLELGDISVQEWLRRQQSYREITRLHERLLLQNGAAIAAYNQAAGESL